MNVTRLAREIGLEESDYLELLALFVQATRSDLMTLAAAVASGDAEKAVHASHSIKGAAANLGLLDISAEAQEIERKSREGRPSDARDAAQKIAGHLAEIARALGTDTTPVPTRGDADDRRESAPLAQAKERSPKR